jgi:hypothetical protein
MTAVDPQVLRAGHILSAQDLAVAESGCLGLLEKTEDRGVGLRAVGHKQVGVLGRLKVAVGDDGETADDDMLQANRVGVGDDARQVRPADPDDTPRRRRVSRLGPGRWSERRQYHGLMAAKAKHTAHGGDIGDFGRSRAVRREAALALTMSERLARVHALCKQMSAIKGAASAR